MESNRERVGRNVRELRDQRGHTVRGLSAVLESIGRRIAPSSITKIESGVRSADPDDLVALAIALGVNPNRLLLPADDRGDDLALTPAVTVSPSDAWQWARGERVLLEGEVAIGHGERTWAECQDDFRRHALPIGERLRDDHTAVRAARDVLASIQAVLDRAEHPEKYLPEDSPFSRSLREHLGPPTSTPEGLRAQLGRLIAEIKALIGDDDGR